MSQCYKCVSGVEFNTVYTCIIIITACLLLYGASILRDYESRLSKRLNSLLRLKDNVFNPEGSGNFAIESSSEKFENNDVQLAWFGGVTGVQAMSRVPGARALVAGQKDLAFKSYFIANASTGLEASEDFPTAIADLKFTYGSSSSTSGCIMPSHFIIENTGKTPMEFFKEKPGFSGAHDKTAMLVQDGSFQAGALSFGTYEKLVAAGKVDPEKCVKIWETPTYADYNMTAHPDLENAFGEGFLDKLQQALVDCQDEAALKALGREKLVKVNNETFAGIAAVMEKVSFD